MRRNFKTFLRAASLRRKNRNAGNEEDIVVDLTLLEGESTTLHYDGSDIMDPSFVSDPNSKIVTNGSNTQYNNLNVIAVGLGTDDAIDEDGRDDRAPLDSNEVTYQGIVGPSRSALFFNLSEIPPDAIIEEATLELEPVEYDQTLDQFNDPSENNIWPTDGVLLEALNLTRRADSTATWNYCKLTNPPEPSNRWNSSDDTGVFPPNTIGMMQNTKRRDYPEPLESYDAQRIDNLSDSYPDEYYGHIGYGIRGGGLVENWNGTGFQNTLVNDNTDTVSFNVLDQVRYAHNTTNQCNLLIRASNWGQNTAAEDPADQVDIFPLTFDSVYLSSQENGPEIQTAAVNSVVYSVPVNLSNFTNVTYEWEREIEVESLRGPDIQKIGSPAEGETVSIRVNNVQEIGGLIPSNEYDIEWYTVNEGGSVLNPSTWTLRQSTKITGPTEESLTNDFTIENGLGGLGLLCNVKVSNLTLSDLGEQVNTNFGNIEFDGLGNLSLTIISGPSETDCDNNTSCGELVDGLALQVRCNIDGVQNPKFDYELTRIDSDGQIFNIQSNITDPSNISPLYVIDLSDVDPASSGTYLLTVGLKEGGTLINTAYKSWSYTKPEEQISWVEVPQYRSGVYRLSSDSIPLKTQPNRLDPNYGSDCTVPANPIQQTPDMKISLDVIEEPRCKIDSNHGGKPYFSTPGENTTKDIFAFLDANQGGNLVQGLDGSNQPLGSYNGVAYPIVAISKFGFGGKSTSGGDCPPIRPTDMAVWSGNGGWRYFVAYPYLIAADQSDTCGRSILKTIDIGGSVQRTDSSDPTSFGDYAYTINLSPNSQQSRSKLLTGCAETEDDLPGNMYVGWMQVAGPPLPSGGPNSTDSTSNPDLGDTWFFHFRDDWTAGIGNCSRFEPGLSNTDLHYPDGIPVPTDELLLSWPNPTDIDLSSGGNSSLDLPEIPEANPLLWNPQLGLAKPSHILRGRLGVPPTQPGNFNQGIGSCGAPLGNSLNDLSKADSLYGYMRWGNDFIQEENTNLATHCGPLSIATKVCNDSTTLCIEPDPDNPDNEYFDTGAATPPSNTANLAMYKWIQDHPDFQYIIEVYAYPNGSINPDLVNPTNRNLYGIISSTHPDTGNPNIASLGNESDDLFPRSIFINHSSGRFFPDEWYFKTDEFIVYLFDSTEDLSEAWSLARNAYPDSFPNINSDFSNLKVYNQNVTIESDIGVP